MTDRERATTLAALRYWQQETEDAHANGETWPEESEHFTEPRPRIKPLTSEEIDALCEKLNAPEPKAPQWHIMPDDEADPALNLFRIRGEANRHVASRMSCEDAERIVRLANEKVTVGLFIEGGLLVGIRSNTPNIEHLVWYHDKGREPDPDEDECEAENKAAYEALPHGIY